MLAFTSRHQYQPFAFSPIGVGWIKFYLTKHFETCKVHVWDWQCNWMKLRAYGASNRGVNLGILWNKANSRVKDWICSPRSNWSGVFFYFWGPQSNWPGVFLYFAGLSLQSPVQLIWGLFCIFPGSSLQLPVQLIWGLLLYFGKVVDFTA